MPLDFAGILAGNIPLLNEGVSSPLWPTPTPKDNHREINRRISSEEGSQRRDSRQPMFFVLLRCSRRGGDTEFLQFSSRTTFFFRSWVALDDLAKFADAGVLLTELQESHAFLQAGRRELETLGVVGEDTVVFGHGQIVVALGVGNFSEVELRVGSEIGVSVVFQVVLEFLTGQIVFAAGNVAQAIRIEGIGRRSGPCWHGTGSSAATGGRRSEGIVGGW